MAWYSCLHFLTVPYALISIYLSIVFNRNYHLSEENIFLMFQTFGCRYNSILAIVRLLTATMDEIIKEFIIMNS